MAPILKTAWSLLVDKILPALRRTTAKRLMIGSAFFIITTIVISLNFVPDRFMVTVGQPSPQTIFARKTVEFEDKAKTAEAKRRAEQLVGKVHDEDPNALNLVLGDIDRIMNRVKEIKGNEELDEAGKIEKLKQEVPFKLPENVYSDLAAYDEKTVVEMEAEAKGIATGALEKGIFEENLAVVKDQIYKDQVSSLDLPDNAKVFTGTLIQYSLRPNFYYNEEATQEKIRMAVDSVAPVKVLIQAGEKVVGEGEIVTVDHVLKLEALGLMNSAVPVSAVLGIAILVGLGMAVVMVYLYQQRRNIYNSERLIILISLVVIITLLLAKTIIAIQIKPSWAGLLGYLIPIASASMVLAVLLDTKLALLVTAVLSGMIGVITGNDLRFTMVGLVSGLVSVYSVSRLSQRSDMAKAGLLYVSTANVLAIVAVQLVTKGVETTTLAVGVLFGLINGVFSAILTIGVLPYLESAFGITSSVKLLELANPGQPLLKQMLLEAPGTYHHSIMVGNLAEAAAEAVGGDALMVRVGSYYHDVGKLRRPYFFIENQLSSDNPHDKLTPNLSTLIITSHTADGVEIAREHRLPSPIADIIAQHHGTSLVSFFFHRAMDGDGNEKAIHEEDFRYEGPKPQTKEAALVMLADSVEAAVRALQRPTPGRIEGLVRRVIKDKLQDGQLDECNLTFKDLDITARAFVKVLSGIFHHRVEYPESVAKEIERRRTRDAGIRKQLSAKNGAEQQSDFDSGESRTSSPDATETHG